jgi:hypothetical protein
LYSNGVTHWISRPILQFIGMLLFFPIAAGVARWNGLPGLQGPGLVRSRSASTSDSALVVPAW